MVRTCHTGVWMWRWRRNPLRRRSDVVEAWIVLVAWVLAAVGSVLAGVTTADAVEQSLDRQRLERHAVTAVLAEDAAGKGSARFVDDDRVWVTVRWTAPDGSARTGQTKVPRDTAAGSPAIVWTDRQGRLTSKPLSPSEANFQATWAGTLAAICAGSAAIGSAQLVRGRLERRRMEEWAAEWQRFGGRWGRTSN
ncbi:hypothetical protein [Streptomyces sp. R41]|uniref:Integral membrane protein n=1 Tax=Streptomyces sp. R41 TaxID=3238632 RepID=A0AB39RR02_9ACTN